MEWNVCHVQIGLLGCHQLSINWWLTKFLAGRDVPSWTHRVKFVSGSVGVDILSSVEIVVAGGVFVTNEVAVAVEIVGPIEVCLSVVFIVVVLSVVLFATDNPVAVAFSAVFVVVVSVPLFSRGPACSLPNLLIVGRLKMCFGFPCSRRLAGSALCCIASAPACWWTPSNIYLWSCDLGLPIGGNLTFLFLLLWRSGHSVYWRTIFGDSFSKFPILTGTCVYLSCRLWLWRFVAAICSRSGWVRGFLRAWLYSSRNCDWDVSLFVAFGFVPLDRAVNICADDAFFAILGSTSFRCTCVRSLLCVIYIFSRNGALYRAWGHVTVSGIFNLSRVWSVP